MNPCRVFLLIFKPKNVLLVSGGPLSGTEDQNRSSSQQLMGKNVLIKLFPAQVMQLFVAY